MKSKLYIALILVAALFFVNFRLTIAALTTGLLTRVQFYGIVIDQYGIPVPDATIEGDVLHNFTKPSTLLTKTDAARKFSIQTFGFSIHLAVSKSGYFQVGNEGGMHSSSNGFDFIAGIGRAVHKADPEKPVVFNLYKAGKQKKLERLSANPKLPRDGQPVTLAFGGHVDHGVTIRCWTHQEKMGTNDRYDWRCEVSVAGGGIQERLDDYQFNAPDEGYEPAATIEMPRTLDPSLWNSRAEKFYWLKFKDGTYARIKFRMISGGDHFAVIEGNLNPNPQSRNLEPNLSSR